MNPDDKYYEEVKEEFARLVSVIYRLRQPDGCPWDRAQTHKTIRGNAIEEAYEMVEAIDLNDTEKMKEEFGDVLLQSVLNSVIAEEDGEFTVAEMIKHLTDKLVFRHTHIFGKDKAKDSAEALLFWEKAKSVEKGQKNVCDKLDAVPVTFTSVMRAAKVQKIAKKAIGFDFPDYESSVVKLNEEIGELAAAKASGNAEDIENEAGDLLFAAVNAVRLLGVDPEVALFKSSAKFEARVKEMQRIADEEKTDLAAMSLEEKEAVYQRAKGNLK